MEDPTAHELVLALQNNPSVLAEVLSELSQTTACGWERLGRLHFRRTVVGEVLGWVRAPTTSLMVELLAVTPQIEFGITKAAARPSPRHPQQDIDLHSMSSAGSAGEARAKIDWHLERRGWFLSEPRPGLPYTPELVAAAAGLMRMDQFPMVQMLRALDSPTASVQPKPAPLARRWGQSTRVAVEALAGLFQGQAVRVLVGDRQRQDHFLSLLRTLIQAMGITESMMRVDKVYIQSSSSAHLNGMIWVLTERQMQQAKRRDLWPDRVLFLYDL